MKKAVAVFMFLLFCVSLAQAQMLIGGRAAGVAQYAQHAPPSDQGRVAQRDDDAGQRLPAEHFLLQRYKVVVARSEKRAAGLQQVRLQLGLSFRQTVDD